MTRKYVSRQKKTHRAKPELIVAVTGHRDFGNGKK